MDFLPVNINIRNRKILLVGGGRVALHKATILQRFVTDVTVLAPRFAEGFEELPFTFLCKSYEEGDLEGYQLLYICTDDHELNRRIKEHAGTAGIFATVCDAPALCDFTSPAILKKDNLTISVATDGKEVKRAIVIRNRIQELIKMVHYKSINRATHSLSEREACLRDTKLQEDTPGIFLKTCNRIEFYYGEGEVPEELIRHLFRVTSGLESSLIGERAVQGQVKEAYRLAAGRFKLSSSLHKLFQSALATGKRVRSETAISQGAVSHSLAVIELLSRQPLCLSNAVITVIGVNKLTRDTLLFLKNKGAFTLFLANRSVEKARLLAGSVGCEVRSLREKRELFALSDVVISATSAPHTLICPEDLVPGQKQIIFDLAFPRDVEETVRDIPGITLFNLEDIEIQMDRNRVGRAAEIVRAETIIEEAIGQFRESVRRGKVYQPVKWTGKAIKT